MNINRHCHSKDHIYYFYSIEYMKNYESTKLWINIHIIIDLLSTQIVPKFQAKKQSPWMRLAAERKSTHSPIRQRHPRTKTPNQTWPPTFEGMTKWANFHRKYPEFSLSSRVCLLRFARSCYGIILMGGVLFQLRFF